MSNHDEELEKILDEIKQGKDEEASDAPDIEPGDREEAAEPADEEQDEDSQETSEPEGEEEPEYTMDTDGEEAVQAPELKKQSAVSFNEFGDYNDDYLEEDDSMANSANRKKGIIIAIAVIVAVIAAAAGVYFGMFYNKEEPTTTTVPTTTTTTQAPVIITNPLTGEADYNEAAVGKRPVAVVVENSPQARPQYNMDTPDIVFEGEVEGGITRMLWLYADMTSLPDRVGPSRSARPGFVEFSEFFDSIFVHFGGSHSKGNYVGGYETIEKDDVDNIDGMTVSSCFKRQSDKASPHNAALLGDKLVEAIEKKGYRTDIDETAFSAFSFYDEFTPVPGSDCSSIKVKVSSRSDTRSLTYNSEDKVYVNESDYKANIKFTNVIVMFADTTYVDKENYKGSGKTETYCNYSFTSGTGKLASGGMIQDFTWSVDNNVLSFKDEQGNDLKLNPGKSWICLASANHEGSVTVPASE